MSKKVLGLDPGLANTGYAVVSRASTGGRFMVLDHGCIVTRKLSAPSVELPRTTDLEGVRLQQIYDQISELIRVHAPSLMAIEAVFFNKNVTSCLSTAAVIGVCKLAAVEAEIPVEMIKPQLAKASVTGREDATKAQVQRLLEKITGSALKNSHVADAAAVAIAGVLHL